YNERRRFVGPPVISETAILFLVICGGVSCILIYTATTRLHFTIGQIQEIASYLLLTFGFFYLLIWQLATKARRNTEMWPPIRISRERDRKNVAKAWGRNAVVLGYDSNGNPWLWPDHVRVMQGIVLGQTGSGK